MKKFDYLIIGGGIAGTSAAEEIRSKDSQGSIAIITDEPYQLYSRVQLPHYLRNEIKKEAIFIRNSKSYQEKNIQLFTSTSVARLNPTEKKVFTSNEKEFSYNKLLIASGGKVNRLNILGNDLEQIVYLRTLEDAIKVKDLMKKSKKAVSIGGGFIGIELAQSFVMNNLETTVVVREKAFWESMVGENIGKLLSQILIRNGVELVTEAEVDEFVGKEKLKKVKLKDGREISADLVGVGIGIKLNTKYLKDSGLKINKGVVTNEFLETSVSGVWAAGDIAEFYDPLFKRYHSLGNWANASLQGRTVGINMAGGKIAFETTSMYSINIFDSNFSFLGDPTIDEETQILERGSVAEGKLARILIKDEIITGVSLINMPVERNSFRNLIKNKIKISLYKDKLSDSSFDLSAIS